VFEVPSGHQGRRRGIRGTRSLGTSTWYAYMRFFQRTPNKKKSRQNAELPAAAGGRVYRMTCDRYTRVKGNAGAYGRDSARCAMAMTCCSQLAATTKHASDVLLARCASQRKLAYVVLIFS
jgi:hypothetical protein